MNEEVKEILDQLLMVSNKEIPLFILGEEYAKILYDYITNLQQENERLKKEQLKLKGELATMWECKARNEVAIEYINNHQPVFSMWNKKQISKWFDEKFYKELLKILLGGDE